MKTVEYYLMRHADYYDKFNEFISYKGMLGLRTSMAQLQAELDKKFPQKKLRIIHSRSPRAKHTALLMEEMLVEVKVFLRGDDNLNSERLRINKEYLQKVLSSCENDNEICLILSHKPDIEHFCKKDLKESEFLCQCFELEDQSAREEEGDGLPF